MEKLLRTTGYFSGLFCILLVLAAVTGCGGGDGGLSDWAKPAPVTVVSNIKGKVLPPVLAGSILANYSLLSAEGTRVFVESKPEYYALADANGDFLIRNVPAGKYRLVAHTVSGVTPYRQRSDLVDLTGTFETQVVEAPLPLELAPFSVKIHVSDVNSSAPLFAKITVWGFTYQTLNGSIEVGPFPGGAQSKEVRVEATGYHPATFLVGFNEAKKSELYVKLTPLTAADANRAPFVEIEHSTRVVKTNETAGFTASGVDADGDAINWSWEVSGGTLSNQTGPSTVFTAPPTSGTVELTLTGKDPDNAAGKAVLKLEIQQGGSSLPDPNNRPPVVAFDPIPAHLSENLSDGIVLRWSSGDPDADVLTYDVLLATQGADMRIVAQNLQEASHALSGLAANQIYFWQVITRDEHFASSNSPVWQFKTGDLNNFSPYVPAQPVPEDLAINQLQNIVCTWTGGDPDLDDVLTYSFLIGKDRDGLQLKARTGQTSFQLDPLELAETYYWQIISADNRGKETAGPIWSFSTHSPANRSPSDPEAVAPASGATDVAVNAQIRWNASDPDGDALTYDLFLGKSFPLPRVSADQAAQSYLPTENLSYSSKYYWQVLVRDARGLTNVESPIWSFTTGSRVNQAPNQPIAVTPASGSTGITVRPVFSWSGGDPDDEAVVYDLYLDTVSPPAVIKAQNSTVTNWTPLVDLEFGRQYYWKVVARDPAGNETSSAVYSFYVLTDSEVDTTPPTILSVSPVNGATGVAQETEVRVIFSESVNKQLALSAFSFVPPVNGAWTWENDATAKFWPTTPWPPGSFNRFEIAGSTVQDLAGKVMTTGGSYSFTVVARIPVPEGFHSMAFPRQVASNEAVTVSVPGLPTGARSYGLVVSSPDSSSLEIRGSVKPAMPAGLDPHSAIRYLELDLAGRELPPVVMGGSSLRGSVVPVAAPVLNETEEFFIPYYGQVATSTPFPGNKITARCVAITDKVIIYADTAITSPSGSLISDLRMRFEDVIQPRIRDRFGNEPELGPDGEGRLTILLTDSMTDGIAGIFYSVDLFARNSGDVQLRESNERKMFYMKYSLSSNVTRYGVMAHEFQHMVNFYQKRQYGGTSLYEAVWLNEGLAKYAEEVCGFGILDGDANTASLIKLSQENFASLSLTEFVGLNSYGLSYLFVRFLAQEGRFGTTSRDVTRKLVNSSLTGTANIRAVTGEDFDLTLARWGLCLYLNRYEATSAADYGFVGLNLAGSPAGINLPGFVAVEVQSSPDLELKANGVRCFVKTSTGAAATNFSLQNVQGAVKLWLFDKRP